MRQFRSEILHWFDAGRIPPGNGEPVLRAAGMIPPRADWHKFLCQLTLWLGTIALANAVIFFFAFNWDDLGRFAKFGLVEAAILVALLACWWLDFDGLPAKAILFLLTLLTGALLALTGQVYQTGADSWQLFAWWAVLILPWVLVGRFSPLWLAWLALLNLATYLYFALSYDGAHLLWVLFGLNTFALILWEVAHRQGLAWLRDSWPPRLVAIASGIMATGLFLWALGDADGGAAIAAVLAYAAWLAALYGWYRHVRPDLFMLAGGTLSLIVAVIGFLSKHLIGSGDYAGSFLLIGLVVIGMSAGGAMWLRSVGRELRA